MCKKCVTLQRFKKLLSFYKFKKQKKMKKIAFVFVAAIATSFAVSISSCSEGNKAADSCCADSACDSLCTELVEDTTANDSTVAPEA